MQHLNALSTGSSPWRRQRGLSLVETLVSAAVASTVLGTAVTAFDKTVSRRHLDGAASQLETDIFFTRSVVAAHQQGLRISFSQNEAGSCYVIHRPTARHCRCDAQGRPVCEGEAAVMRTVHLPPDAPVRIEANVRSMLFDPVKGTVTPTGTVRVTAQQDGATIHQIVSLVGRVRSCSPGGRVAGVPAC